MFKKLLPAALTLCGALYLLNASWLAATPHSSERVKVIAHRGVHQIYDRKNLGRDDCTATRIFPHTHDFLENTIPSMNAAFNDGADVVEIDIHPTTDGHFAVFHDWTADCRTNGSGVLRDHTLAELQTLDIGYGYTADDGRTYPFRGKAVGLMPSLRQVLDAFPNGKFLLNFKSNDPDEADRISQLLTENPAYRAKVWGVYGGEKPTAHMADLNKGIRAFTAGSVKTCLKQYIAYGWTGHVPDPCRNTQLLVPVNYAPWLWGWPNRFLARMDASNTDVILTGPYHGKEQGADGLDTLALLKQVPDGFSGYIWTNRVELIGPELAHPGTK